MNKASKRTQSDTSLPAALGRQADEIARKNDGLPAENQEGLTPKEILQLIHDLRAHQIKLQIQNEELRGKQVELDGLRARYFDLYDMAPVGYFTISEKGLILETNFTAARLLGTARSAINKQPITRFILAKDQDIYHLHDKRHLETGRSQSCELRMMKDDGTPFWVHLVTTAARDSGGAPVNLVVMSDITERKQAEKEREMLHAQLNQAQKIEAIGSLAGGIAHDLNNILFPISGLSEMLIEDSPPESPERESLEQIHKSAQRGRDLVKQILSFSRQSNIRKLPIRIQTILKEALKLARAAISRNIEITSHIPADCGMISADPTRVHQIMMNLITNAHHAVEENGGAIHIELKETDIGAVGEKDESAFRGLPSGRYACIAVSDTGTGIDQTRIDKIFDPYFTTKAKGKGTGLGLSVVHGIVTEHGGHIRVQSEAGKGTTFYVYLPLLKDAADVQAAVIPGPYPTGSESILLVDDEAPVVCMEQKMLGMLGYKVTARTSSPDALAVFKADPDGFDLVISDRGMPNMTGEQLAREIISIRPEIPVILCTGFSDESDVHRAKSIGVSGFLTKPVAMGDFAAMLRNVLDGIAGNKGMHPYRQADAGMSDDN